MGGRKEEKKEKERRERQYCEGDRVYLLELEVAPLIYLNFNCLFLRYPRKTGQVDHLAINKSMVGGRKRVCYTRETFLDSDTREMFGPTDLFR